MDSFCGSIFWNSSLTWYTDNPDFTPCFQKTVLVWIPCLYLWLAAFIEVYQMMKSKEANIPWNKLNISKLFVTLMLILLHIIDIGQVIHVSSRENDKVFDADYYDPVAKLLTFVLSATLLCYNKKYGLRTSGVLFMFWLLLILAGLPQLRTEMMNYNTVDDVNVRYNFASYIVYYSLIILMFILNCFADLPPRDTPYVYDQRQSPENSSGVPSRLTFSWFDPIAITGYRRTLTEDDIWCLNPQHVSKEAVARFEKFWNRALRKRDSKTNAAEGSESSSLMNKKTEKKPISILPVVCMAFGAQFVVGMFIRLVADVLTFASPELLKLLIGFVEGNEPVWRGYLYAVAMFVCATIQTVLLGQTFLKTCGVSIKIKSALNSMVYRKALSLSNEARKKNTVGEIVNLMSTDVDRFSDLTFINLIWSAPLQISLALYFLWGVLGPSVLAGLAVIVVLMPFNGMFARKQQTLFAKLMKYKDERIKLMNEILNGIKVLKMYGWEPSFQDHVLKIRNKEMQELKKMAYYNSASSFIWFSTPLLVSMMSFACFVLVNDKEVLDSQRVFVALSLFNILRFPMSMLPHVLSNVVQTYVSIKRLNKFLNSDQLDSSVINHNPDESDQIVVEEGTFSWEDDDAEPLLQNINMHIPRGSLVAVVGAVGSGKSSLLAALLGEMNKVSGRVNIKGVTSYVAQQSWIQNDTVQNNVLFGKTLDRNKYNKIIKACALKPDFDVLPGGDQTEIGEKGINLSGGQKQRVSLARAVYYDADNYFLDDPLSAVDSHVGKHIFDKVIGPSGLLKNKTRVWVTHNVSYLAQTDLVLVLREGHVSEAGTYQQLLEKKGVFAEFLLHHLSIVEQTSAAKDLEDIKQDLESKLGPEFERKLQWARSISLGARSENSAGGGDRDEKSNKEQMKDNEEGKEKKAKEFDQLIEAETTETGRVKWAVYKHYLSNVGVGASVATAFIYILLNSMQIGTNFWLARWSNDNDMLVNGTVDTKKRDMYLGVYGGLGAGQAITALFSDLLPFLASLKAARILHEVLLKNILRAPLQFFEVTPVGRIVSRFSTDVNAVDVIIPWQISSALNGIFEVLGTIFVVSYSTPMFLAVIFPIGILYYVIQRFYVPTSRQLMRIKSVARSPILSHFNESVLGATSIRAFGVQERFASDFQEKVDHFQKCFYLSAVADRWLSIRLNVIGSFVLFFAALFAVIGRENLSPGLAGLSISYTLEITKTLTWLVQTATVIENKIVSVERMKEYAETEQEAEWTVGAGPRASWPETGAVQLEGLTLAYRSGAEPVLRDVTCTVAPRDKLGIVGRTGAGKSTLTLGLFRIVEAVGGRILIDGLDVAGIGLHQLRSRITIIPQDPVLFSGTLRMNLDPFETYSDQDVWRALEHAHLKPFVQGLQAGLRHEVSEGGENLSVGQRQLVCLARALLRKTPLLVLDEATAAVDLETDELIQKTIRSEFAACTVLTIAHRLNTIMDSTKVMVLDKGQLVEFAPPEQLLQDKNSIFYSMAKDAGLVN
ncbi:multidrug resistance-associated protein 1-like isoform X2 [Anticarsia gemmatalis]|uniref:multidrug resistance-associated protein 1-like isoform X2 n=1 Tax=Anticarsia gemmatalis TaxID=129554 RepID=UPI003F76A138